MFINGVRMSMPVWVCICVEFLTLSPVSVIRQSYASLLLIFCVTLYSKCCPNANTRIRIWLHIENDVARVFSHSFWCCKQCFDSSSFVFEKLWYFIRMRNSAFEMHTRRDAKKTKVKISCKANSTLFHFDCY